MIKEKLTQKTISFVIAGCMVLSLGGGVFTYAANDVNNSAGSGRMAFQRGQNSTDTFKTVTDALVKDGTITQAKADSILAYLKDKMTKERPAADKTGEKQTSAAQKISFTADMVTAGILTQAEADAFEAKLKTLQPNHQGQMRAPGANLNTNQLSKLVEAGTITKEQQAAIVAYQEKKNTERKAEMDKVKAMTEAERKAYFEANKDTVKNARTDMWSELVTAGIITQEQADTIKANNEAARKTEAADRVKKQLQDFVTDGTITADQVTAIINYQEEKNTERKAEMDKVKDMTEAERKAYFEANKDAAKNVKIDMWSELVTAGIVTQEQADAIKAKNEATRKTETTRKTEAAGSVEKQLQALVTAGTITADQVTAIVNYQEEQNAARKVEMDKIKDMTKEEAKAYFEANKDNAKDSLAALVTNGTLTQAQADAVNKVLHNNRGGNMQKGFPSHKDGGSRPMNQPPASAPRL